jgi:hypothetical protein
MIPFASGYRFSLQVLKVPLPRLPQRNPRSNATSPNYSRSSFEMKRVVIWLVPITLLPYLLKTISRDTTTRLHGQG